MKGLPWWCDSVFSFPWEAGVSCRSLPLRDRRPPAEHLSAWWAPVVRHERLAPARRPLQGAMWSEGCAWRLCRDWARGWFCSPLTLGPEPSPLGSGRLWWGSEMSVCAQCLRVLLGRLCLGASWPGVVPTNWGPGAPLTEPLSVGSPRPGWSWYPCPLLLRGDWLMG